MNVGSGFGVLFWGIVLGYCLQIHALTTTSTQGAPPACLSPPLCPPLCLPPLSPLSPAHLPLPPHEHFGGTPGCHQQCHKFLCNKHALVDDSPFRTGSCEIKGVITLLNTMSVVPKFFRSRSTTGPVQARFPKSSPRLVQFIKSPVHD